MPRQDPVKTALEAITECRKHPADEATYALLKKLLAGRHSIPAARAADMVAEFELPGLEDDLVHTFQRFMKSPIKNDRGCSAKTAIIKALDALGYYDAEIFLAGLEHVQLEPVYGGRPEFGSKDDTAAAMRGRCAAALIRLRHPDAMRFLVQLLHDPWPECRLGAVAAARYAGNEAAELLLRSKALSGDPDPQVTGDCLAGLMEMAPAESLSFVARFLNSEDEGIAEQAALALGESRLPEAFPVLMEAWKNARFTDNKIAFLLPLALLRTDESLDYLISRVREGSASTARAAVQALAIVRHDPEQAKSVLGAMQARSDRIMDDLLCEWQDASQA